MSGAPVSGVHEGRWLAPICSMTTPSPSDEELGVTHQVACDVWEVDACPWSNLTVKR